MQSRNGAMSEAGGSHLSTPSAYSTSGDISELTPGTFAGSHFRMTPRQTPRQGMVPSTPSLYNSPAGFISELTPGGYSPGLMGDDDYDGKAISRESTPSMPSRTGVISELTLTTYGILLEEADEDDIHGEPQFCPSTPSLHSPAGVVSELTPGTHGINLDTNNRDANKRPPIGPLPVVNHDSQSPMSELTPGTFYGHGLAPIPTTPSVHSPADIVSELSPSGSTSEGSLQANPRMPSNVSTHSGAVSDITPFSTAGGSAGQVQIAG